MVEFKPTHKVIFQDFGDFVFDKGELVEHKFDHCYKNAEGNMKYLCNEHVEEIK